jgi:hypothetical protein
LSSRPQLMRDPLSGLLELSHQVELSSSETRSLAQLQRILNIAAPDSHRTFAVSQEN